VGTPPVALTLLSDIAKILTFSTALNFVDDIGTSRVGGMPMLTAVVNNDADTTGVTSFIFTCGRHPTEMLSQPFKIAAKGGQGPRTLKIKAVGLDWVLETAGGDRTVNQP
jgi:hypothetical protein